VTGFTNSGERRPGSVGRRGAGRPRSPVPAGFPVPRPSDVQKTTLRSTDRM